MIKILYIGDVVGQPGRRALHRSSSTVVDRERIDFTIVNIENAAGGFGVTEAIMEELSRAADQRLHLRQPHLGQEGLRRQLRPLRRTSSGRRTIRPEIPARGSVVRQTAAGVDVAVLQLDGQRLHAAVRQPLPLRRPRAEGARRLRRR